MVEELSKHIEIKIVSSKCFVGLEYESEDDGIVVNQIGYIESVIARYRMQNCGRVRTPIFDVDSLLRSNEKDVPATQPYRQLIGCLNYIACVSRPDITFSVSLLSRFNTAPCKKHWVAAKNVLGYLKDTLDCSMRYKRGGKVQLQTYSDADWGSDCVNRKSISGIIMYLGGGPVLYKSKQQSLVALSSTEVEYIAASSAARETIWARQLLEEITDQVETPTIYIDNQSAIKLVNNSEFHARTKHLDIRLHHLRDSSKKNLFQVEYIPTQLQRADVLTKSLGPKKHSEMLVRMNLRAAAMLAMITACMIIPITGNSTLAVEDIVIWNKMAIRHIKGHVDLGLELAFTDPCKVLFKNITTSYKINRRMVSVCSKRFRSSVVEEMQDICGPTERRTERDGGATAAIAAVSAVVLTAHRIYSDQKENSDRHDLKILKQLTLELENRVDQMTKTIIISNNRVEEKLNDVSGDLEFVGAVVDILPEINDAYNQIHLRFDETRSSLRSLKGKLKAGNEVPRALLQLFNLEDQATATTIQHSTVSKCQAVSQSHVHLEIALLRFSDDVEILQADPFFYWSQVNEELCKFVYKGPEYVIYNKSSNCIGSVMKEDITDNILLGTGCKTRKSVLGTKQHEPEICLKLDPEEPLVPKSQVKRNGNMIYINCQGRYITINKEKQTCPNHVFSLQRTQEWSLDDYSWTYERTNVSSPNIDYGVPGRINIYLGLTNVNFQSLTADDISEMTGLASAEKRKKLKEELAKGPSF